MGFSFVVSELVRSPRVDARHAVKLSVKLQRRAPRTLSAAAKQELSTLRNATEALNASLASDLDVRTSVDGRPIAWRARNAWSTLRQRLDAVANLDATEAHEVERAQALMTALFTANDELLVGDFESAWLRGQHTLEAMERLGVTEEVEALVGAFVLRVVRARQHALGVSLGLAGSVRPAAETTEVPAVDRRALLDAVTASIARYAGHLTAIDVTDDQAVRASEQALQPLLRMRARSRTRKAATDEGDDTVKTPAQPANGNATDAPARRVA